MKSKIIILNPKTLPPSVAQGMISLKLALVFEKQNLNK